MCEVLLRVITVLCQDSIYHYDGLVQDCGNSSVNTLELLQSCTKLNHRYTCPADNASSAPYLAHWSLGQVVISYGKFSTIFVIDILNISGKTTPKRMPQDLIKDESTLLQVMGWCRKATIHYLNQWWHQASTWISDETFHCCINGLPNLIVLTLTHGTITMQQLMSIFTCLWPVSDSRLSRDHSVHAPSQCKMTLHCNVVSYWLGACTKWSLTKG